MRPKSICVLNNFRIRYLLLLVFSAAAQFICIPASEGMYDTNRLYCTANNCFNVFCYVFLFVCLNR